MAKGDLDKLFKGWLSNPDVGQDLIDGNYDKALKALGIQSTEEIKKALEKQDYNAVKELAEAFSDEPAIT
jgi:hypothetical protein